MCVCGAEQVTMLGEETIFSHIATMCVAFSSLLVLLSSLLLVWAQIVSRKEIKIVITLNLIDIYVL